MFLFSPPDERYRPWYVEGDSRERNERARKAYTALLTITARTPDTEKYRTFSAEASIQYVRFVNEVANYAKAVCAARAHYLNIRRDLHLKGAGKIGDREVGLYRARTCAYRFPFFLLPFLPRVY